MVEFDQISRGGGENITGMLTKTHVKNLYLSNPAIAKEWHPSKNGSLTPKDVTLHANRKVWWLCSNNHVWSATINERIRGGACPYCSGKEVDDQKNRQAFDPSLAKEWHPTKNENLEVWWLCSNGHEWSATVQERIRGKSCPYCSGKVPEEKVSPAGEGLQPGKSAKQEAKKINPEDSLQAVNPKLAKEWHPAKNGNLTPSDVTASAHDQVWWLCAKGHEWKAAVSSRHKGQGCFYCSYMHRGKRQ